MLRLLKWFFRWERNKTIDKKTCKELICFVEKAAKLSPKQQVIEYDKIYHHALKKMGYLGTFGEMLKVNPREIKNINEIWELHKFRNTLVHELRDIDERYILKQGKRYKEIVEKFVKQITK